MANIEVVYRKTDELIPYEKNPRKNDEAVGYVANSIKEFGFKVPIIVDCNDVIVAGHTRLKAAKKLGIDEVPVIVADDLTEEQINALRLADNRVSEFADWDMDTLLSEIDKIQTIDMSDFGFEFSDVIDDMEKDQEEEPEIQFAEVLGEESNYLILKFTKDIDWINAKTLFGITSVKCYSTRKDGKITDEMVRVGVGRVLDGVEAIDRLREALV